MRSPFGLFVLLLIASCEGPTAPDAPGEAPAAAPPRAAVEPCVAGARPPEGGACLARADGRGLLVFVHGLFFADGDLEARELVIRRARAAGVSVLAVYGRRGQCDWSPEMADAVCWPTEPRHDATLRELAARWVDAMDASAVPGPRVLLGHSNGAFAVARVATLAGVLPDVDGYVVVAGGLHGPLGAALPARRIVLRAGEDDPHHRASMEELDVALRAASIPHTFTLRPGGHALGADDVDAALALLGR